MHPHAFCSELHPQSLATACSGNLCPPKLAPPCSMRSPALQDSRLTLDSYMAMAHPRNANNASRPTFLWLILRRTQFDVTFEPPEFVHCFSHSAENTVRYVVLDWFHPVCDCFLSVL